MKIVEDITCQCCENIFRITFDDSVVADKLMFCVFCGEDIPEDEDEEGYIEDEEQTEDE